MPGLFQQQPQAAPPPQGAAPPPPSAPVAAATPQQAPPQGQGDEQGSKRFLANVLNVIYNDKTTPAIIERLKNSEDPASDLAQIAVNAIVRVEDSAEQNGIPTDKNVIVQSGAEIVGDIAELSSQFGGHKFSDEEIQKAFLRGVDLYRTVRQSQGKIDPKAAQADLQQLNAAGESGQLEQQYPGMGDLIKKMSTGQKSPDATQSGDDGGEDTMASDGGNDTEAGSEGENADRFAKAASSGKNGQKPLRNNEPPTDSRAKPQGQFKRPGQRQKKGKR